jgi:hypothetical protein
MVDVVTQTEFWKCYKALSARIELLTGRVNCNEFVVASLGKEFEELQSQSLSQGGNKIPLVSDRQNTQKETQNGKRTKS